MVAIDPDLRLVLLANAIQQPRSRMVPTWFWRGCAKRSCQLETFAGKAALTEPVFRQASDDGLAEH